MSDAADSKKHDAQPDETERNEHEAPDIEGGQTFAKISPIKIPAGEAVEDAEAIDAAVVNEVSLIEATRIFLRSHGVRKSGASVREAVEMPHDTFAPPQAVSALSTLGFKASFGSLKLEKLGEDFFPLIAFTRDGDAVVIHSPIHDGRLSVAGHEGKGKIHEVDAGEFSKTFSGYVILAKELNAREKDERSGHWFFSAFRKSKWLYVQVMVAAMVSNFLSLTTSLFTMTVYDRIIPNGAFESLIALSIGVVIALGFDFLIKSLRARFIDTASKRADLEISRRLFDRILTLTPA